MTSTPSIPAVETPAAKPERTVDIKPEDITLGSGETDTTTGKNKLVRPRSSSSGTTSTGLQV